MLTSSNADMTSKPIRLTARQKNTIYVDTDQSLCFKSLSQVCAIELALREMDRKYVRMIPGILQMEMDTDMNLFDVVNWSLDYTDNTTETVEMELILKRKIKSELLTTFLPTILLTMITFATSFFKPFFFEAALSVNLTTMLVMTTIFISKMESLPPSSDTKMIDIWLIICQLVPFSEVVLLTAVEYLRADEDAVADNEVVCPFLKIVDILYFSGCSD